MVLTLLHSERPKLYGLNPVALRKAKIVHNICLSECNRNTITLVTCNAMLVDGPKTQCYEECTVFRVSMVNRDCSNQ